MNRPLFILGGIIILMTIALTVTTVWRSPSVTPTETTKLRVTTSFYPLYFFASEIGGEYALVTNITPAGAEPHEYEPTPKDIAMIESSNLLLLAGKNLEPWGDEMRTTLAGSQTTVIVLGEDVTSRTLTEDGITVIDPHIWLSPTIAKTIAARIASSLEERDPPHAEYYRSRLATLTASLDDLDQVYRSTLTHCTRTDLVTTHASFGYLADAYNLRQIPIAGVSPDEEPSPKQLAAITKLVKARGVTTIFFENLVTPKFAQTIAQETGAATAVLDPLEGLTPEDVAAGKNYFTQMRQNLDNIKGALACTP